MLEQIIVVLIVLVAAIYCIRNVINKFKPNSSGCGGGCSCGSKTVENNTSGCSKFEMMLPIEENRLD